MGQAEFDDIPRVIMENAYGPRDRVTLDGEWTEEELKNNVYDECLKSDEFEKYRYRALNQTLLLLPDYMATLIIDSEDIIDAYNREASKDRSKYGIAMFDNWIHAEIKRHLENEVVK